MNSPAPLATLELPHFAPTGWGSVAARCLASGEKLFDVGAVVAGIYLARALHRALRPHPVRSYNPSTAFLFAAGLAFLFVVLLERRGGYRPYLSLLAIRDTERVLHATLQTFSLALGAAYFFALPVSRTTICFAVVMVPLVLTLEKWKMHKLLRTLRSKGYGTRRAVILGTGSAARRIYTALVRSPKLGVDPVAFVESNGAASAAEIYECSHRRQHSARVLQGPLCPELFRQLEASVLIIAEPGMDRERMSLAMSAAAEQGIQTFSTALRWPTSPTAAAASSTIWARGSSTC